MRRLLLCLILPVLGWPGASAAQVRIVGHVIDNQSLEPIPGVEIRVAKASLAWRTMERVYSDEDGRFTLFLPEKAGYIFRARSIGYEPTETPILWTDGYRHYEVEIRLDPDAVLLAPIEVLTRMKGADSPVLADFHHRLASGLGQYITHRDIEQIKPTRVTDLLARVPGVRLESSGAGLRRVVHMARGCRAEIFVDGRLWTRAGTGGDGSASTVDDAVHPASVLGIEVYRGLATVPAEFLTPQARCGVVAIWTRR